MEHSQNWYELLQQLVPTSQARKRLAELVGVNILTIHRWLSGASMPNPRHLRALLNALPEHKEDLLALLPYNLTDWQEDFDTLSSEEDVFPTTSFYAHIMSIYRQISMSLRASTIQQLILNDALDRLDPGQEGVALHILHCLPPRNQQPVRSLYIKAGRGTAPWNGDLEYTGMLQGIESLSGTAINHHRPLVVDRRNENSPYYPSDWAPDVLSIIATPIMSATQVAGCLMVSSTQSGTELTSNQELVVRYADLLALAVEPEEWYTQEQLQLRFMPPHDVQQSYFDHFYQKIIAYMAHQQNEHNRTITYKNAQMHLLQDIEDALVLYQEGNRQTTAVQL